MARTKYTSIEELTRWVAGIPQNQELECAPKGSGGGKTPNAHWRPLRRDLSDLPRGVWYTIRIRGTTDGVQACIPNDAAVAITGEPQDKERLWRERQELCDAQMAFWERRREIELTDAELEMRRAKIQGEYQRQASEGLRAADELRKEVVRLIEALGVAQSEAAARDANSTLVESVHYFADKVTDLVGMWRMRKHYDVAGLNGVLSVLPDTWKQDFREFMDSEDVDMGKGWEHILRGFLDWRRARNIGSSTDEE